jgi:hypothetical protein
MSNSVFFDTAKYFHTPGSLDYALQLIWLILLWIVSKMIPSQEQVKYFSNASVFTILDYSVIGLTAIAVIGFFITYFKFLNTEEINHEFVSEISLFIGYFIMRNWFLLNNRKTVIDFLFSIVTINSIASLLYIVHQGLHFEIYLFGADQMTEIISGQEFTRNFWYAPAFPSLSVVFLLMFWKKYPGYSIILLTINLLGIFITYTRSLSLTALLIFLLYFILVALKRRNLGFAIKNIFIFSIAGLAGIFILSKALPNSIKYFNERFSALSKPAATEEDNSFHVRIINTGSVISKMDQDHRVFGMGPVTELQVPEVEDMRMATADMVWTGVIYRWGLVGLLFFTIIFIYGLITSFKLFWNSNGISSDLGLLIFIFIISQIIESFFSWTFLSGHGLTIGLWYFALLRATVEYGKNDYAEIVATEI